MTPASGLGRLPGHRAPNGVILVLYYSRHAPLRASAVDHLFSFRRYSGHRCIYINVAVRRVPAWVVALDVELVVFHTLLLATRWHRPMFRGVMERIQPVKRLACPKVALPQDEYIFTNNLIELLREFEVETVFTCAPESELPAIYGDLVDGPMRFIRVMAGYLEPVTIRRIERLATGRRRSIDIGYRAYDPEASLGRHAQLKSAIARVFQAAGSAAGLATDISMRARDTLLGDRWYEFLLDCRWVVGVEGGASVLDQDGRYLECSRAYARRHPNASFEEVEQACFPGQDGGLAYVAISPRHLEACVTRTGQALVEGSYNGILEAGVHYLPIRSDFSDAADIAAAMMDEGLRTRLAERAYADVVATGKYTYPSFVHTVLESLPGGRAARASRLHGLLVGWEAALDGPSWRLVWVAERVRRGGRTILERVGLFDVALSLRDRMGRDR